MAAEPLKLKARDELIRLTEKDLQTKFGSLNAKRQSVAATKFYRTLRNTLSSSALAMSSK